MFFKFFFSKNAKVSLSIHAPLPRTSMICKQESSLAVTTPDYAYVPLVSSPLTSPLSNRWWTRQLGWNLSCRLSVWWRTSNLRKSTTRPAQGRRYVVRVGEFIYFSCWIYISIFHAGNIYIFHAENLSIFHSGNIYIFHAGNLFFMLAIYIYFKIKTGKRTIKNYDMTSL